MKVLLIAGARPNFMKIAPLYRESLRHVSIECKIVHTGQHYDYSMSQSFFEELEIPAPDFYLNAGSGSHAMQTATIMVAFEEVCLFERPDLVIVVGDVNSTLACSVVAKKLRIDVAHVEAGLRSFDLAMPEEINRMVTDAISNMFFVTEESGRTNLLREGKADCQIHMVGHVMIDNLFDQLEKLREVDEGCFATHGLKEQCGKYAFLTLHRPSNVDDRDTLTEIAAALNIIAKKMPVIFPVHPRTDKMLDKFAISLSKRIFRLPPLGYRESLYLWKDAALVITDSGGLQEETTALGIPCITIRDNTERPITLEVGSNLLAGTRQDTILAAFQKSLTRVKVFKIPPKWDGQAAKRIWQIIMGVYRKTKEA